MKKGTIPPMKNCPSPHPGSCLTKGDPDTLEPATQYYLRLSWCSFCARHNGFYCFFYSHRGSDLRAFVFTLHFFFFFFAFSLTSFYGDITDIQHCVSLRCTVCCFGTFIFGSVITTLSEGIYFAT